MPIDLPYGKYRITVWGNLKSEEPLGDDLISAELEHADAASRDVYLADAEVKYALGAEHHTVELERTKGRLIIVLRTCRTTSTSPIKRYATCTAS